MTIHTLIPAKTETRLIRWIRWVHMLSEIASITSKGWASPKDSDAHTPMVGLAKFPK